MAEENNKLSNLWRTEDYWAIWLGFLLLIIGGFIYFSGSEEITSKVHYQDSVMQAEADSAPFKTIAYYQAMEAKMDIKANQNATGKWIQKLTHKPHKWEGDPLEAFYLSGKEAENASEKGEENLKNLRAQTQSLMQQAQSLQAKARQADFTDPELNQQAEKAVKEWYQAYSKTLKAKESAGVNAYNQFPYLFLLFVAIGLLFGVGYKAMNDRFWEFFKAFAGVFVLAVIAYFLANQATIKDLGISYAAWAIVLGLVISNTVGTPQWMQPALQTEYFIKTGLVLLGAEILFGKIISIGLPGIFVAWVVTPTILITTYLFGQKVLKITSKSLNITICADMSVCGVSAAIATAAACKAKKEELTLAVGLSLAFTSIMMILLPAFINAIGMDEVLGGAWIGGTIDATGAVVAAGAFLGDRALNVAATIKMIQNVLIGLIAFGVAVYWAAKVEKTGESKVTAMEIWYRFPKFILGFIFASIVFSLVYEVIGSDVGYALIDHGVIRGFSELFRGWFFCLAFISIGLSTNFRAFKSYLRGGKPFILYICGQTLNILLTLLMAYLMFYVVFPEITETI